MWLRGLLIGCVVMAGCAGSQPSLRARSSGDLRCDEAELKIYKLDERAYRVIGCNQEVVYISICDAPEGSLARKCTWSLDTARSTNAAGKPSAKPATPATEGCSFDTQCKGDRVCVKKECVAPATSSSAPLP